MFTIARHVRRAVIAIGTVTLIAGCSSVSTTPTTAPIATTAAPIATVANSGSQASVGASASQTTTGPCYQTAKTTFTVAMIRWAPADIYFNGEQLGEQIERDRIAKDCGVTINWKVFGADDVSQQITALQADLAAGVDGVDISPYKESAFTTIVKQLNDQKMPLVTHGSPIPGVSQVFVGMNNAKAGEIAGNAAIKALDAARGQGWRQQAGVFIELRCIITATFDIGRDKGYHAAVDPIVAASGGKITVETREVSCDDSKARSATDDIISKDGPDKILAVLGIDGDSGFGAASALQARGIQKPPTDPKYIPVVAVDGSEAEFIAMSKGAMLMAAEQPAVAIGIVAERLLYQELATGQLIPTAGTSLDMPDYSGAPWLPVAVTASSSAVLDEANTFTGAWYEPATFDAASLPLDDHWHWANILDHNTTGQWPHYDATGCASGCPKS